MAVFALASLDFAEGGVAAGVGCAAAAAAAAAAYTLGDHCCSWRSRLEQVITLSSKCHVTAAASADLHRPCVQWHLLAWARRSKARAAAAAAGLTAAAFAVNAVAAVTTVATIAAC